MRKGNQMSREEWDAFKTQARVEFAKKCESHQEALWKEFRKNKKGSQEPFKLIEPPEIIEL